MRRAFCSKWSPGYLTGSPRRWLRTPLPAAIPRRDHPGRSGAPVSAACRVLRARIQRGDWAPRRPILSETRLCEEYGLSRPTVRRAIAALMEAGWLFVVPQRGTFVADRGASADGDDGRRQDRVGSGLRLPAPRVQVPHAGGRWSGPSRQSEPARHTGRGLF
ncbi:GntR family transcriptional regulator [Streptomyces sp. I05A-00742]|uniref:winged helix-turn-helix domain-containing protein n=1 Tax=Streptomyces sp. I05A-00742 TaxID=2732853 RepID=UPI001489D7FB